MDSPKIGRTQKSLNQGIVDTETPSTSLLNGAKVRNENSTPSKASDNLFSDKISSSTVTDKISEPKNSDSSEINSATNTQQRSELMELLKYFEIDTEIPQNIEPEQVDAVIYHMKSIQERVQHMENTIESDITLHQNNLIKKKNGRPVTRERAEKSANKDERVIGTKKDLSALKDSMKFKSWPDLLKDTSISTHRRLLFEVNSLSAKYGLPSKMNLSSSTEELKNEIELLHSKIKSPVSESHVSPLFLDSPPPLPPNHPSEKKS